LKTANVLGGTFPPRGFPSLSPNSIRIEASLNVKAADYPQSREPTQTVSIVRSFSFFFFFFFFFPGTRRAKGLSSFDFVVIHFVDAIMVVAYRWATVPRRAKSHRPIRYQLEGAMFRLLKEVHLRYDASSELKGDFNAFPS